MDNFSFFRKFVEEWTMRYKPMLHFPNSANKRFYMCDGFAGFIDMMKSVEAEMSPCVQMESSMEGFQSDAYDYPTYTLYFCVRATEMGDGTAAAISKEECKSHMRQFILWMKKNDKLFKDNTMFIDYSRLDYTTIGPIWDGWNAVKLTVEIGEATNICIDESLLLDELPDYPLEKPVMYPSRRKRKV